MIRPIQSIYSSLGAGPVNELMPVETELILSPNAFSGDDIARIINQSNHSESACLCCCSEWVQTGVGEISIWLDQNRRPFAIPPNRRLFVSTNLQEHIGTYQMADGLPFQMKGVCIVKVELGSVYFAHNGAQPIIIQCGDSSQSRSQTGWFVSIQPGFKFADCIEVNHKNQFDCRASLATEYSNFESLHLFNVLPNTAHVVSNFVSGRGNEFIVLPPGTHAFSAPVLKSAGIVSLAIQNLTITEEKISTQDGIQLTNCEAVLSYQISIENVHKLLQLDIRNYSTIINDWAKRTMLHEIGNTVYQAHNPTMSTASPVEDTLSFASSASVLGTSPPPKSNSFLPGSRTNFRSLLETQLMRSLDATLSPYGIEICVFALQSFEPPAYLVEQASLALARRSEAQFQFQSGRISNQQLLTLADAEAEVSKRKAVAVAKAASLVAKEPHARQLQLLDKQIEIAKAWSSGTLQSLTFIFTPNSE